MTVWHETVHVLFCSVSEFLIGFNSIMFLKVNLIWHQDGHIEGNIEISNWLRYNIVPQKYGWTIWCTGCKTRIIRLGLRGISIAHLKFPIYIQALLSQQPLKGNIFVTGWAGARWDWLKKNGAQLSFWNNFLISLFIGVKRGRSFNSTGVLNLKWWPWHSTPISGYFENRYVWKMFFLPVQQMDHTFSLLHYS